jgi:hypothetical protein
MCAATATKCGWCASDHDTRSCISQDPPSCCHCKGKHCNGDPQCQTNKSGKKATFQDSTMTKKYPGTTSQLKIIQINLQHSKFASSSLAQLLLDKQIDAAIGTFGPSNRKWLPPRSLLDISFWICSYSII